MLEDIHAEFVLEIGGLDPACLELQDQLSHEKLMRRWPHATMQRQLASLESLHVGRPLGLILIMDSRYVAETGYSSSEQIGAVPKIISVTEIYLALVLNHRIGARH